MFLNTNVLDSRATKINNLNQIVGWETTAAGTYGYVRNFDGTNNPWAGTLAEGQKIQFPDAQWTKAYGINDFGVVVGQYMDLAGNVHGFIANPVPIPAAAWLLGAGLIGLVGVRRKFSI